MGRLRGVEDFIVAIEDSTSLMRLYLQRVARSPANLTYRRAMAAHATEIKSAVEILDSHITHELALLPKHIAEATVYYVEYLVELSNLMDELCEHMSETQTIDIITEIDLMREGISALEKVISTLSRVEIAPLEGVPETIAKFHFLLHGETLDDRWELEDREKTNTDMLKAVPTASASDFDEEDPFDELTLESEILADLLDNFENALDAIVDPEASTKAAASGEVEYHLDHDADQLQDLFANIASSYLQPMKSLIIELRDGPASKEWIEVCHPALESVSRAAYSMNYVELSEAVSSLDHLLLEIGSSESRFISGTTRQEMLARYEMLEEMMPQAFTIIEDYGVSDNVKRDAIIINSLLKQINGVGVTTIRKLFAAGMNSLNSYYNAKKEDLAPIAGIKPALAEIIINQFREYKLSQPEDIDPQARNKRRLHELLTELRAQQFLFRRATLEEWYSTGEESESKKTCRKQRQQTMWKINMALAEEGSFEALELVKEMRKLIFERRIEYLQQYLEQYD